MAEVAAEPVTTKWVEFPSGEGTTKRTQIAVDLPKEMEQGMIALFTEFQHLFVTDHKELKQTNLREHRIKLQMDAKPVV